MIHEEMFWCSRAKTNKLAIFIYKPLASATLDNLTKSSGLRIYIPCMYLPKIHPFEIILN
jgi:hypothetical protein